MRHATYTCNKKNEPTFKRDCMKCPEYNPCAKDGNWCFVGALVVENENIMASATQPSMANMAAEVMVKHDYRDIKIAQNTTVTIDLEEIKERLSKRLMPDFLQYGG